MMRVEPVLRGAADAVVDRTHYIDLVGDSGESYTRSSIQSR